MDLIQPFVIGLLGSLHCLGMCGPIALALPLKQQSWQTRFTSGALYNLGRTFTYGFLGFLLGFLGLGLHIWGIQQWVSIGVGTLMILGVAYPVLFNGGKIGQWLNAYMGGFKKYFGRFFRLRSYTALLVIGLLNGLLPCGLVYIALAGALLSATPLTGAIYMIVFGIGTVPALLAVSLAGNALGSALRARIRGVIPLLILLVGMLFVLRGMNLGIPYISPKMKPAVKTESVEFNKPECCH